MLSFWYPKLKEVFNAFRLAYKLITCVSGPKAVEVCSIRFWAERYIRCDEAFGSLFVVLIEIRLLIFHRMFQSPEKVAVQQISDWRGGKHKIAWWRKLP